MPFSIQCFCPIVQNSQFYLHALSHFAGTIIPDPDPDPCGSGSTTLVVCNVYSDDWDLGCCGAEPDVSIEECEPSQDVEGLHHYLLIVPPLVLHLTIIKTVYEFCDKCCGA